MLIKVHFLNVMFMSVFRYVCMNTTYRPTAHGGERRVSFLETGVTVFVSCQEIWVLRSIPGFSARIEIIPNC